MSDNTLTNDPLLQDILNKIEFRLLQPHQPGSLLDSSDISRVDAYASFDVANTHIHDRETKLFTMQFLVTPRLSRIANAYVINRLVKNMPADQVYLNVGVWCGFSLFSGIIGNDSKICIGVDNFCDPNNTKEIFEHQYNLLKNNNSRFYEDDYLKYFNDIHKEKIGVYFYDGDHAYGHQMLGLDVADPYIAPGGYILVDDTNTEGPRQATLDFLQKKTGQYSLVLDIKTANNSHPTFWNGLMILKKSS